MPGGKPAFKLTCRNLVHGGGAAAADDQFFFAFRRFGELRRCSGRARMTPTDQTDRAHECRRDLSKPPADMRLLPLFLFFVLGAEIWRAAEGSKPRRPRWWACDLGASRQRGRCRIFPPDAQNLNRIAAACSRPSCDRTRITDFPVSWRPASRHCDGSTAGTDKSLPPSLDRLSYRRTTMPGCSQEQEEHHHVRL
jgi:hypothetical protein